MSVTVALVPGTTIRSGSPRLPAVVTSRTPTPGSTASASRSVALATRGSWMAATSTRSPPGTGRVAGEGRGPDSASESSASSPSPSTQGSTPTVGTRQRRSSSSRPGARRAGSPRNLLITNPRTSLRYSRGSSSTVPYSEANTPPLSMSPTTTAGRRASAATRRLTMSWSSRLTSAGLPAPSQTTTSKRERRSARHSSTSWSRPGLASWYPTASMWASGLPITTTWLVRSPVGLRRIGFMATSGSTPAARACTPWARPISCPAAVT